MAELGAPLITIRTESYRVLVEWPVKTTWSALLVDETMAFPFIGITFDSFRLTRAFPAD